MPILLNTLLEEAGLILSEVRLLRHKDKRALRGRTPYELWRDNREQFDLYQSVQSIQNRGKLRGQYWISFVVTPGNETLLVGVYKVNYRGLIEEDTPKPHMDGIDPKGSCDTYDLTLDDRLSDLSGKIIIEWGSGERAWIQRADNQSKQILEVRAEFKEPEFPGFLNLISPLSKLDSFPQSWVTALKSSKGIYLLTCPKTKEQYVGAATSEGGLWSRWQEYTQNGHASNVALKSRDPSDYQVSILEVAGTASTTQDIFVMESRWKLKLQSREMGLNRN